MQLWTPEHIKTLIPTLIVMLVLSVLLRLWLKDKPLHVRMIPLQVVAIILVLLEIGKQIVSASRGYDLYHIPLHFCSLVLFSLPVIAFYRGKHRDAVASVAVGFTSAVFVLTSIYPALIYSAWDIQNYFSSFFAFHTVTFHNLAMFAFMLMVALNVYQPKKGDWRYPVFLIGMYCVIAGVIAHLIATNFNNLYRCNVAPLESVRQQICEAIGYVPTQIIYVAIVTCLDMSFTLGAYHFYRLCHRLVCGKAKKDA